MSEMTAVRAAIEKENDPGGMLKSISIVLRIGLELARIVLFLLLIIFIVSLVDTLAQAGGDGGLQELAADSVSNTLQYLGLLFAGEVEVLGDLAKLLFRSIGLLLAGVVPGVIFGVLLGGFAAINPRSRLSSYLVTSSILGISTPSYIVAMFLIWSVVGFYQLTGTRLLPVVGFGWDVHLILPLLVLATQPASQMMRFTFATLSDVFETDYIRTAYGKGVGERAVLWRHALRNAGVPLLTTALVSLQLALSMLPIVEYIFSWPGIGLALLQSVQRGNLVAATTYLLPLAILFLGASSLLRASYSMIDPRLKDAKGGST